MFSAIYRGFSKLQSEFNAKITSVVLFDNLAPYLAKKGETIITVHIIATVKHGDRRIILRILQRILYSMFVSL